MNHRALASFHMRSLRIFFLFFALAFMCAVPGLSSVAWAELPGELLWVHHEDAPCAFTSYRDAMEFSRKTRKPLVTVRGGGPGRGGVCEAFTAHGFVGVERETVIAMRSWVKTGVVPAGVIP